MSKMLQVAQHEYLHHLRRKGFWAAALGLPLGLVLLMGLSFFVIISSETATAIGYVDQAGLLAAEPERIEIEQEFGPPLPILRFADEPAARQALDQGQIEAYFVIPPSYRITGEVTGYAPRNMPDLATDAFEDLLRRGLATAGGADAERLIDPISETITLTTGGDVSNPVVDFLAPFLFGLLLVLAVIMSGSYLMQSLVTEKENRLMEVLITSVRPVDLMGGKIFGLGLLGITQFAIWVLSGLIALAVARTRIPEMADLAIPWNVLGTLLLLFLPAYILFAAMLAAIGAAVTATQEGNQLASVVSLLAVSPTWAAALIVSNPDSALAVGLSLFPITAPMTLLLRMAVGSVPAWQFGAAIVLMLLADAAMIWLAARVVRFSLLRYGKRLSLRDLRQALRG